MTVDIEKKVAWARRKGASEEDLDLLKIYYRKARMFRKGLPCSCIRCGRVFHKGSILCKTSLIWLCLSCYNNLFIEVS